MLHSGRPKAYIGAERQLLIASETYASCMKRIKELKEQQQGEQSQITTTMSSSSTATLTLSNISIPLGEKLKSVLENQEVRILPSYILFQLL